MKPVTYSELVNLLGDAVPAGIQCVYTVHNKDETFDMCEQAEANHISTYLRIENGEVVPVRDFPIGEGIVDHSKARALEAIAQIRDALGELPLEKQGALDDRD